MEKVDSTGLKFDEEQEQAFLYGQKTSKIISWIIKYSGGLVKNKKQAEYVSIGIVIIATLISFYLLFGTGSPEAEINVDSLTGMEIIPGQVPDGI